VEGAKPVAKVDQLSNNEIMELMDRAQGGDQSAMPPLQKLMEHPEFVEFFGGNLAQQAQLALIHKYSGKNLLVRDSLRRQVKAMAAELAGANASPLERLLVDRIVACWLHLHHLEAIYANRDNMSLELGSYYQRCISAAHKRYLSAIKTLAAVRKLAVPVLQVNIARKQVNVGACPTPPAV